MTDNRTTELRRTLTAEQVRKAIYDCSIYASYDGCMYHAIGVKLQAITDELNAILGSGTCKPIIEPWESDKTKYDAYCGNCKYPLGDGKLMPWNCCPSCGAKIRKAVER